ncbi:MAG: NUDIX domain-containing protein [Anaerolineae bacterium]|nr:NUDIX domain-containing protein [Anaerolineae bacterium]
MSQVLLEAIQQADAQSGVAQSFRERVALGALTRDEDPHTHFCVFFAAYDPARGTVFVGHHRKADLWLFNGGHIDRGEQPMQAVLREIREEWGLTLTAEAVGGPHLLTITEIDNPTRQTCTRHYDIWHFLPFDSQRLIFDAALLAAEYYECHWLTLAQAAQRITDPANRQALAYIQGMIAHE